MFDGPMFTSDKNIETGWVNVAQLTKYQSFGVCWDTREDAIGVADKKVIYRIHVKVKTSHMVLTPMTEIVSDEYREGWTEAEDENGGAT